MERRASSSRPVAGARQEMEPTEPVHDCNRRFTGRLRAVMLAAPGGAESGARERTPGQMRKHFVRRGISLSDGESAASGFTLGSAFAIRGPTLRRALPARGLNPARNRLAPWPLSWARQSRTSYKLRPRTAQGPQPTGTESAPRRPTATMPGELAPPRFGDRRARPDRPGTESVAPPPNQLATNDRPPLCPRCRRPSSASKIRRHEASLAAARPSDTRRPAYLKRPPPPVVCGRGGRSLLGRRFSGYAANEFIRSDYTARTQVFVAIHQPVVFVDVGSDGPEHLSAAARRALVQSRPVLQAAVNRPGDRRARRPSETTRTRSPGWRRDLKTDFSVVPRNPADHPDRAEPDRIDRPPERRPRGLPGRGGQQGTDGQEGGP